MTNKELLEKLIFLAANEVGTREVGGNNCGKDVREYQSATWLAPAAWPWCSALQCWLLREWLQDQAVVSALHILNNKQMIEAWRCRDASAYGWEKWAKTKGLQVLPETALAKMGDIVVFDFSHVGIVEYDQVEQTDGIHTIEGNTNGKGERDSTSGDGVWRKVRAPSLVKCYVRLLES